MALGIRFWVLGSGFIVLRVNRVTGLGSGFKVLGIRFWVLGSRFIVLGVNRVTGLGSRFWVQGFGFNSREKESEKVSSE